MLTKGFRDPRRRHPGQQTLDPDIARYLRSCRDSDPAPKPQQALPAKTVRLIQESYGSSADPHQEVTGNLIVLAFFFLLRVGEYTPTSPGPNRPPRRTVPLRKGDVTLYRNGTVLSPEAPLEALKEATGVRLNIENQKNGQKGATLYHTATGEAFCPVVAAAILLYRIRGLPADTPLGTHSSGNGRVQRVTAQEIRQAIRHAARYDRLETQGYDLARIGSHSLRSGGAMALKLAGYDEATIKKLGRWSSDTYLVYIQSQIANLTSGLARAMARTNMTLQWHA